MKIWKIFLVFQLCYILLVYLSLLVIVMIGWGLGAPKCLPIIIRVIVYPVAIVIKILTDAISKEINHFIIVIIASAIVAAFFTALVVGINAVVKKL